MKENAWYCLEINGILSPAPYPSYSAAVKAKSAYFLATVRVIETDMDSNPK